MTVGRIIGIAIVAVLGGVITGFVARSFIIGIAFPILVIIFIAMQKSLKNIRSENTEEIKKDTLKTNPENKEEQSSSTQPNNPS